MHLNTTPATNRVNPTEARQLRQAFHASHRPGCCGRTLLASIVAAGALAGIDYSQEEAALAPELLRAPVTMSISR